jgi:hypothetical protein
MPEKVLKTFWRFSETIEALFLHRRVFGGKMGGGRARPKAKC